MPLSAATAVLSGLYSLYARRHAGALVLDIYEGWPQSCVVVYGGVHDIHYLMVVADAAGDLYEHLSGITSCIPAHPPCPKKH